MPKTVVFAYTNHRGETQDRTVRVDRVHWSEEGYPEDGHAPGWFLTGFCMDRMATRTFAFVNMRPCADGYPLSGDGVHILLAVR